MRNFILPLLLFVSIGAYGQSIKHFFGAVIESGPNITLAPTYRAQFKKVTAEIGFGLNSNSLSPVPGIRSTGPAFLTAVEFDIYRGEKVQFGIGSTYKILPKKFENNSQWFTNHELGLPLLVKAYLKEKVQLFGSAGLSSIFAIRANQTTITDLDPFRSMFMRYRIGIFYQIK